ncbi:MAG: hypothetical protein RL681_258 [Candidatus Parcubacteria bacterium]|jgi:hypothetical protein
MSVNSRTVAAAVFIALLAAAFYVARAPKRESGEGNITARAEAYCIKQDVAAVFISGNTIKVVGSLLGAGATYIRADGTELQCPVVAPDAISDACKAIQAVEYWTEICDNANRPAAAEPENTTSS